MHGDAARAAFRRRLVPVGLLGRKLQHRQVPRMLCQQLRRMSSGSFPAASASWSMKVSVEKAVWVWPTERHHNIGTPTSAMCRDAQVGDGVGQRTGALDHRRVDAVLDHAGFERRALHERLPDDDLVPADDVAFGVDPAA